MAQLGHTVFFNASHGKNLHKHNFRVEVVLEAPYDPKTGFVAGIDVHDLMSSIDGLKKKLENQNLNELFDPASMENIAHYFIVGLKDKFPIKSVKIAETENRYAIIFASEVL